MNNKQLSAKLVDQQVTYTLLKDGQLFVVKNVPAQVNTETGEQYFSPATVTRLHEIIRGQQPPVRLLEAPVYAFT